MTDYYKLYGVEPAAGAKEPEAAAPAETGEKEQGIAAPADTDTDIDAGEPEAASGEAADTAQASDASAADAATDEPQDGKPDEDSNREQSAEQRRKQAALRREREKQQAEAELRQKVAAERDAEIAALGLINPATGQAVQTLADLQAMQQARKSEQLEAAEKELQRTTGLKPEVLQQIVANTPEVREAQAAAAAARQAQEQAAEAERQVHAKAAIEQEIAEIGKLDPSIKSLADLADKPYFAELSAKVQNGYGIADAYRLITEPERLDKVRKAAAQAALNNVNGKQHHQPHVAAAGAQMVEVPQSVLKQYRLINPRATDEEIKRHYNADLKARND